MVVKRFLLKAEVAELEKYELDLDDQVGEMSLRFFEQANTLIEEGTDSGQRKSITKLSKRILMFIKLETLELDGDKKDYPEEFGTT